MDPDKVLQEIIDFAVDGDGDRLADVAFDMVVWLRGGGFPPKDPRKAQPDQDDELPWCATDEPEYDEAARQEQERS